MKKTIFLIFILTMLLAACGGTAETASSTDSSAGSAETAQGENGQSFDIGSRELPISSALAIGTLKLEDTDQAIASDQAADLLPLWQVLNSLTTSDTAAQEEIYAVLEQIQETMTPEQMAAIEAMELTYASANPYFVGDRQKPEGDTSEKSQGSRKEIDFGEKEMSPEQIATKKASRTKGGDMIAQLLEPLVQAVIELLESKVQ